MAVKLREEPPRRQLHGPVGFDVDDMAEAVSGSLVLVPAQVTTV